MLTGDKLETAENIGYSCKLIKDNFIIWKISTLADVQEVCSIEKVRENENLIKKQALRGLLVEAGALTIIMNNVNYRKHFLKISKSCEAVICCRVSPSQKADVVRLIK